MARRNRLMGQTLKPHYFPTQESLVAYGGSRRDAQTHSPATSVGGVVVTPAELFDAGKAIFGETASVAKLARFLGRDRTTVWRYLKGESPIPEVVATAVRLKLEAVKR